MGSGKPVGYRTNKPIADKQKTRKIFLPTTLQNRKIFFKAILNLLSSFTLCTLRAIIKYQIFQDVVMLSKKIAVSGGFDPIHVGHVRMILEASKFGEVIVIANSDSWLKRKKGYVFMPWDERSEILSAIRGVSCVIEAKDSDGTVCESLIHLKESVGLDYFANGGDRKKSNTPEMSVCKTLKIEMIWNCGGEKIQSSSELVERQKMLVNL